MATYPSPRPCRPPRSNRRYHCNRAVTPRQVCDGLTCPPERPLRGGSGGEPRMFNRHESFSVPRSSKSDPTPLMLPNAPPCGRPRIGLSVAKTSSMVGPRAQANETRRQGQRSYAGISGPNPSCLGLGNGAYSRRSNSRNGTRPSPALTSPQPAAIAASGNRRH